MQAPVSGSSWANAANYIHGGDRVFSWPRPDGPPLTGAAWSAASRVFNSYGMHQNMGGGWWPKEAVKYRLGGRVAARAVAAVRHVRRPPVPHLAGPACRCAPAQDRHQAVTGAERWAIVTASTTVTKDHSLASWLFPRLVSALLDTPDHMTT